MYATTAKFLETFGIKSLEDLPRLPDEALGTKPDKPEELSLLDFAEPEAEEQAASETGAQVASEAAETTAAEAEHLKA